MRGGSIDSQNYESQSYDSQNYDSQNEQERKSAYTEKVTAFFFFVATMQRASLHHDYLHLDLVHKTRERVDH